MSHLRCPLCGRLVALSSFDPSTYKHEIVVVKMTSLGRGRGFKIIGEFSALGDEILTRRIADRMRLILQLIEGNPQSSLRKQNIRLEDQVEELEDEVKTLLSELRVAKKRITELEEGEKDGYRELLSTVNEVLEEIYDEEFTDLGSAIEVLIREYEDLLEEVEDESSL